jgi:hypothetical protein
VIVDMPGGPQRLRVPKVTPRNSWCCRRKRDGDDGDEEQRLDRGQEAPAHADVATDRLGHRDGDGPRFDARQQEGEEEFVPGEDQAEHRGCGQPSLHLRKADPEEHPGLGAPVDAGGVLDVAGELVEEALHHPDRERQVEGGIEQHDAGVAAREAGSAEHQEDGNDDDDRRQHARGQDDEQVGVVALERIPREAVGGQGADEQRQRDARARDEHGIEEEQAEAGVDRLSTLDVGAAEYIHEVLERGLEQERRGDGQGVVVRLEGGEDPQHRKEVGERDDAGDASATPAGLAHASRPPHSRHHSGLRAPLLHEVKVQVGEHDHHEEEDVGQRRRLAGTEVLEREAVGAAAGPKVPGSTKWKGQGAIYAVHLLLGLF